MEFWQKLLVLLPIVVAGARAVVSDKDLPITAMCPDGSIPINSVGQRCGRSVQLHWAGRKCDSVNYACPMGFTCLAAGMCCYSDYKSQADEWGDLCHMTSSAAVHTAGSCSRHADCKGHKSEYHACCRGKCVFYAPRCLYRQLEYFKLQSTGRMPRQHLPICKEDGSFHRVQEDSRFGLRWCVNESTGEALTSGCCLPDAKSSICPRPTDRVHACPRDMCSMEVCESRPDAVCRVNPCGDSCTVEFVDSSGRVVNCSSGAAGCSLRRQKFFETLAELHARDQSHPEQPEHFDDAVWRNDSLRQLLHTCPKELCVKYQAASLEPSPPSPPAGALLGCPEADSHGHWCDSKCSSSFACNSSSSCCYTGCGLECVQKAQIPRTLDDVCSIPISSGHCPSGGCHRMCKRWGYDKSKSTCRSFWYAGAGGNNNRYESWSYCMWAAHHCHEKVHVSLPVRPNCRRSNAKEFANVQWSDNGFAWCVDRSGKPTVGSLHSELVRCRSDGSLVQDERYRKRVAPFKATCPGGRAPKWCHDVDVDRSCRAPGVLTFADACDDCKLIHMNADGVEVTCHSAADVCGGSTEACRSPAPRFTFNKTLNACGRAPVGEHSCGGSGGLDEHNAFSREDFCLHACSGSWCPGQSGHHHFYPDLCVRPNCSREGVVCVADDCNGVERYVFPGNWTEVAKCRRQHQPFDLASVSSCGAAGTTATTTARSTTSAASKPATPTPASTATPASTTARTTAASTTAASTTAASTTAASTRAASTTAASTTAASTTAASTTAASTTAASTTAASTTAASTTAASTTAASTTAASTTTADRRILSVCQRQQLLPSSELKCSASGQFVPKQCTGGQCYCVVVDSGVRIDTIAAVSAADADSLTCPVVETTTVEIGIRFDGDYKTILPDAAAEEEMKEVAAAQISAQVQLQRRHVTGVTLKSGSIVTRMTFSKEKGDSADLPASAYELKELTQTKKLRLSFRGNELRPSTNQQFDERLSTTQAKAAPSVGGGGGGGGVGGIVAGVVIAVLVLAAAGAMVFVAFRRRSGGRGGNNASVYETMSETSSTRGPEFAHYNNEVYESGLAEVGDYDNLGPTSTTSA